jgi:hypothetical protein
MIKNIKRGRPQNTRLKEKIRKMSQNMQYWEIAKILNMTRQNVRYHAIFPKKLSTAQN